jgi:Ca2+-binding RTX toxin-like protein
MALINGDASDNVLRGTGGRDRIFGRGDDDRLFGRAGNDRLVGGDDDDVLVGGRGNDRLVGGDDGDRFVFRFGRDVITDFDADEPAGEDGDDILDLRGIPGLDSFAEVRAAAHNAGGDLVLDFGRNEVVLLDFQLSELGRADVLV